MAGFGWNVLGGVCAGIIASAIVLGLGRMRRQKRNREDFGRLAGEYHVTEKHPSERTDGTVKLIGGGPVFRVVWTLKDGSEAEGTLSMNEQSRMTGAGSYEHFRGGGGWGDFSLQVAARERGAVRLLVDGRYTNQTARQQIATAWVWEMQAEAA